MKTEKKEIIEIVYTAPSGRREVKYKAEKGSYDHDKLLACVQYLQSSFGMEIPYSYRYKKI